MPRRDGAGRPTKYARTMPAEAEDILAQDRSLAAVCAQFNICRETLTNWRKRHPAMDAAIRRGKEKGIAKFEEGLRAGITAGHGQYNALAAALYARNVHGYDLKQRIELSGDAESPIKTTIEIKFVDCVANDQGDLVDETKLASEVPDRERIFSPLTPRRL